MGKIVSPETLYLFNWINCFFIYSKMIQGLTRHLDRSSNYFVKKQKSQNSIIKTLIISLKHHYYNTKLPTPFWRKKNLLKQWGLINCGLRSGSAEAAGSYIGHRGIFTLGYLALCFIFMYSSYVWSRYEDFLWCGFFATFLLPSSYYCKRAIHTKDLTSVDFFHSLCILKSVQCYC